MSAPHRPSSAHFHLSPFNFSPHRLPIRPSNFLLFGFFLLFLNFALANADPSKMNNKIDKTSAEMGAEEQQKQKTNGAEAEEEIQTCTVRVQVVKKVVGKCVRLHGGNSACQTDDYLDPVNEDCIFA